jgi:3-dehydroquinate dehydratase-1
MKPKLCVSIVDDRLETIVKSSKKAKEKEADLLELRLDYIPNLTKNKVEKITKSAKEIGLPVILTIRTKDQGGQFYKQKDLTELFLSGIENVDFIDVELETHQDMEIIKKVKDRGIEVIVSHHDIEKTLSIQKILEILEKEKKLGADICKVVCKANDPHDNLTMLSANMKFKDRKIIFCMGGIGLLSRVLSPFFGSEFIFTSLESNKESAPGQLDIETTKIILSKITD